MTALHDEDKVLGEHKQDYNLVKLAMRLVSSLQVMLLVACSYEIPLKDSFIKCANYISSLKHGTRSVIIVKLFMNPHFICIDKRKPSPICPMCGQCSKQSSCHLNVTPMGP